MLEITESLLDMRFVTQRNKRFSYNINASSLGNPCSRSVFYNYNWCNKEEIPIRRKRIFDRGKREEDVIYLDLLDTIPSEKIERNVKMRNKFVSGEVDFLIDKKKIIELKCLNSVSFRRLRKTGIEEYSSLYFSQCVIYCDLFNVDFVDFIAINKNDDERYFEKVFTNKFKIKELYHKSDYIKSLHNPPPFISNKDDYFLCKLCVDYDICKEGKAFDKNCRTCSLDCKYQCDDHFVGCDKYRVIKW